MEFIHAKYRNIFAYGNELQEFYFNRNNIKLIIGGNGFGKSSIGKIIKIGTYHEYDGIPVDEIANSINGNGFIEICLNSNNHNWIIQTEFSFTKLKEIRVYKDGSTEPEDWGKIPDTKERIKKEIITVPYYLINNISNFT
jgi:DNA repair exonuclease SbcCD ATPase subunit